MNVWVVLVITYGGWMQGEVSYVALPSQDACERAMEVLSDTTMQVLPDTMLQCVATEYPTVRPKPRPKNLMGDLG